MSPKKILPQNLSEQVATPARLSPLCGRLKYKNSRKLKKKQKNIKLKKKKLLKKKIIIKLGVWNIRTLLDSDPSRPARRTALIAQDLARYDVNIAALSETGLPDEGSLTEDQNGYTFYWSGYPAQVQKLHGVGFAVKNSLAHLVTATAISARLMKITLPLYWKRNLTIYSCYAPTLDTPEEEKDTFYEQLDQELQQIPTSDKVILLGDFNARVGSSHQAWSGVIGKHGIGKANANGYRLLSFCSRNQLVITNTIFQTK